MDSIFPELTFIFLRDEVALVKTANGCNQNTPTLSETIEGVPSKDENDFESSKKTGKKKKHYTILRSTDSVWPPLLNRAKIWSFRYERVCITLLAGEEVLVHARLPIGRDAFIAHAQARKSNS